MNNNQHDSIVSLAEAIGAKIESYKDKPIGVYFTIEQLQRFVQSTENNPKINLPYTLIVRDAGDSSDTGDDWSEGYYKGNNDCILEVERLNNL
jgi:hypothetical protein